MPHLVAIDLPAGEEFVDALRRVWDRGDAALPVDQRLAPPARAALLEALAPAAVIEPVGGPAEPRTSRRAGVATETGVTLLRGGHPVEAGDALVMATSGTTGAPKGVVLTHRAVEASALATSERLGVDPGRHRWLSCLPLNHVGGLSVVCRALVTGTPLDVLAGFDLEEVIAHSGPEVLVSLVPTTLARVGAARFAAVVLGGSTPPAGLAPNVFTTYGLTETGSGVVYGGVPLTGVEVRIDAVSAEVSVRGPMLLRAYRDGSVPLDADGWFATGDAGRWDTDGRLVVDGRIEDLIVTGGENVWPTMVEEILLRHPGVADVAVTGRPDSEWGQCVVAYVVASPAGPPALDELRSLVRDAFAGYAAPRRLVMVDALPRTAIGKVRRNTLGSM